LPRGTYAFSNLVALIGRALTQYKDVVTVSPATPAREAIRLLTRHRFNQVPVVDRGQVAGLFSYRSFSLAVVNTYDLPGGHRADGLSVWECIETPAYIQNTDEVQRLFDELDRRDAVLVGSRGRCEGIITAMGVLRYLFEAASPFLLVAEIELALRAVIELVVDADELGLFASASLTHYKPENMPAKLEDMTFNDYILLIGHSTNWQRFNRIFHADRGLTHAKLKQVRDLRNDVFHFRREFADRDRDTLTASRDWMFRLVSLAEGQEEWM
jgi:CBS domain-containing protein